MRRRAAAIAAIALLCLGGTARAETREPPGRKARPFQGFVSLGIAGQLTPHSFTASMPMTIYAEDVTIQEAYRAGKGKRLDIGGGARLTGRLIVGGTLSVFNSNAAVHVSGSVPNPFFFDQLRPLSGDASGEQHETDIHIHALLLLVDSPGWLLAFGGGPTVVSLRQDLGTALELDDTYPFTSVGLKSVTMTPTSGRAVGGHVTLILAAKVGRRVAIGADIRWHQARVKLPLEGGGTITVRTGGVQAGAMFRVLF